MINLGLSLVTLGLFSLTGIRVAHNTSAATANPYGSADYCALENNQTVIYGWAADPDATSLAQPAVSLSVGTVAVTAQTNRANYRDAAVHAWIDSNRAGDPKPGTYGFKVLVPGLVKGNRYPISGTALNEGPGSNVILQINNSSPVDGDNKKPFFADNSIPDSCLPNAPGAARQASAGPALPDPKTAVSDITGSSVTAGTMAAEMHITTANTVSVRVVYGENPLKLDQSSSDIPTGGPQTTVSLTGLDAGTSYVYRVVRTDAKGKKTTSPLGNFDTLGFVVALHFVDNRDVGLQGITAALNPQDKPKISDDNGTVQFTEVSEGNHTIQYSYLGKNFTKDFTADSSTLSPAQAAAPHVLTLDYAVNIQEIMAASAAAPKKGDNLANLIVIATLAICVSIIGVFLGTQYMRRRREEEAWLSAPPPPLPEYHPLNPQLPPVVPGQPGADHMGESLKELVLEEMHGKPDGSPR